MGVFIGIIVLEALINDLTECAILLQTNINILKYTNVLNLQKCFIYPTGVRYKVSGKFNSISKAHKYRITNLKESGKMTQ